MNILLALIVLCVVLQTVLIYLFMRRIHAILDSLPSMGVQFTKSFALEVKATLMGMRSGQSRLENAAMEGLTEDAMQGTALGAVASMFPGLAKKLAKHPAAFQLAMDKLGALRPKSVEAAPANGGNDYAARLGKFGG